MHNEATSSMQEECTKRVDTLFRESHTWLLKAAYNVCKSREEAEELVSDCYIYLCKECRPKLFWGNSYNLIYLHKFLKHRWINRVSKLKRYQYTGDISVMDKSDTPYDEQRDIEIMKSYDAVIKELKSLQITRLWPAARLYEMYWMSEDTLNEVAKKIGISKSTTFLAIKKIRNHMSETIQNPFH
jgi:DNA-directed RNA polymerase specialized sigma24 family protein